MGSSRSEYGRDTVNWIDIRSDIEEMAWKKSGFQNIDALMNHVRLLPIEERLEMLTEVFIKDISKVYLKKRQDFMEGLGKRFDVSPEEMTEHAKHVYPNLSVDTLWFEHRYICPDNFQLERYRKR